MSYQERRTRGQLLVGLLFTLASGGTIVAALLALIYGDFGNALRWFALFVGFVVVALTNRIHWLIGLIAWVAYCVFMVIVLGLL